ncbi:MAG TPA: helix-hairpin-helix domain-containing protein, partial [Phnomibacter sp.]|nr:helix-hairpin-helix domain-containing protein [Phnomibacter sp.]
MPVKPRKTWKYFIRSYLYFPKWQRRSLVIIWLGLIAAFISKYFYIQAAFKKEPALPAILQAELEELNTDADSMDMATPQLYEPQPTTHYTREMPKGLTPIAFDPNTVSPEVLAKMGLRQKAIENIINYRNRGGRFKQPEDLNKLYGLLPHEKAALIPFASIAAVSYPTTTGPPKPDSMARVQQRQQAAAERVARLALDINGANQEAWEALPGIGPALAARILKFRNSLGGFYSINQVAETFGLPDSTFDRIRPYL